ncbi:hypothetical protein LSCM1_03257 [Leishmania martiniquensis]|uniref:Glycosomal membrane protein-like protein n=1 Tax=Leishmania martiniquensis TaxID=1580590 RepID=A0A836KIV3_9TRYP|nr:hypothetical protein LSCM1_03257 [Leishmania martiniquensis]
MSKALLCASRTLERTDSVDKLAKFMVGVFTILSAAKSPRQERYGYSAKQLTEVRSLLRVSRSLALTLKMRSLLELFAAHGFMWTERKKFVEFSKVIFDFIYAVSDYALLITRKGLVSEGVDVARLQSCSVAMRLCCHLLGTVFNLFEFCDAARKREYDPQAALRACRIAAFGATRDALDAVLTLSVCRYAGSVCQLSPRADGALRCLSGGLSMYLSWQDGA